MSSFADRRNAFMKHDTSPLAFISVGGSGKPLFKPKALSSSPNNDSSSSFDVRLDKEALDTYEQELELLKKRKEERARLEQKRLEKEQRRAKKAAKKAKKLAALEKSKTNAPPAPTRSRKVAETQIYPRWEFGKTKTFVIPDVHSLTNQKAATTINRMMRGWWARLNVRLRLLEYRCSPLRTEHEIAQIKADAQKKMEQMKERMEMEIRVQHCEVTPEEKKCQDRKKLIAYFKEQNMKLREKNDKLFEKIQELKQSNADIEASNKIFDENMKTLQDHYEKEKKVHAKLQEVIPKYKESVEALEDANGNHAEYGECEHLTKVLYAKCIGEIMKKMEQDCKQKGLIDELLDACLDLDDDENPLLLEPIREEAFSDNDSSVSSDDDDSSSSDFNDHRLASFE